MKLLKSDRQRVTWECLQDRLKGMSNFADPYHNCSEPIPCFEGNMVRTLLLLLLLVDKWYLHTVVALAARVGWHSLDIAVSSSTCPERFPQNCQ